jgi:hypothetical protein
VRGIGRWAGPAAAVALLVGGCATAVGGQGVPAAPAPGAAADAVPGPPRPRDAPVGGVLPCELLTGAQRAELGLDGEPQPFVSSTALFGEARSCSIRRFTGGPAVSFNITVSDTYGLERFYEAAVDPPVEPIVVAGYAAVLSRPRPATPDNCAVAVDVAPGEMVGVLLRNGGDPSAISVEELCREVPRYAEAVMATLLAR